MIPFGLDVGLEGDWKEEDEMRSGSEPDREGLEASNTLRLVREVLILEVANGFMAAAVEVDIEEPNGDPVEVWEKS